MRWTLNAAVVPRRSRAHFMRSEGWSFSGLVHVAPPRERTGEQLNTADSRSATIRSLYPVRASLRDGSEIVIRLIGPEDAPSEQAFVQALSAESRYFRFM